MVTVDMGVSLCDLVERGQALRSVLRSFDAELLTGSECAAVVKELGRAQKACAAAQAVAATRAVSCGAHRQAGFADGDEWLARVNGTTLREARDALKTAAELDTCPDTKQDVAEGRLSLEQAKEIVDTEKAKPGSEHELRPLAHQSSLAKLRDRGRELRHKAIGPDDLHDEQVKARQFHGWQNRLGNIAFRGEVPPEVGVPILNRLNAETDRIRREAKQIAARAGTEVESRAAYMADAFVKLMADGGDRLPARRSNLDGVIVIDLRAYRSGHAHDGEPCHIIGGSILPVSVAKEMMQDAFIKAVIHNGVEIKTVVHFGRHMKAELRTALELGFAPDFIGVECIEAGCNRKYGLQWDHVDPVANNGPTSYENIKPRCTPHHQEKTERDREAGLLGPACPPPKKKRAPP